MLKSGASELVPAARTFTRHRTDTRIGRALQRGLRPISARAESTNAACVVYVRWSYAAARDMEQLGAVDTAVDIGAP